MSRDEEAGMSNDLILPISDFRNWDEWSEWDPRFKDCKTLAYDVLTHLDTAYFAPRSITMAYDTSITRKARMEKLATCYALNFAGPYEEACALLDRYRLQLKTGKLDGDLAAFKGDESTLKKELDKFENYIDTWQDKFSQCTDEFMLSIVKNFSDKEIQQTLEPKFKEILRNCLFNDQSSKSVLTSVCKGEGYESARNQAQECFDDQVKLFRKARQEARRDWAKQLGISYEAADERVKPKSFSSNIASDMPKMSGSRDHLFESGRLNDNRSTPEDPTNLTPR